MPECSVCKRPSDLSQALRSCGPFETLFPRVFSRPPAEGGATADPAEAAHHPAQDLQGPHGPAGGALPRCSAALRRAAPRPDAWHAARRDVLRTACDSIATESVDQLPFRATGQGAVLGCGSVFCCPCLGEFIRAAAVLADSRLHRCLDAYA